MASILPADLREAESRLLKSIIESLQNEDFNRISINLKFEGLRIMPVVLRLSNELTTISRKNCLAWPDAGGTALAKREYPTCAGDIYSFRDLLSEDYNIKENTILIAVSPQPYDYEDFINLCDGYKGVIIMVNGRLVDSTVGIGSIGRDRNKSFLPSWHTAFSLEPLSEGALMREYPHDWSLFKLEQNGYRYVRDFRAKPNQETIMEAML